MDSRRSFIKKIGGSAALAPLGLSTSVFSLARTDEQAKPIRIGIIGAENSHTIGYGKMFNIDKKFPGVEVKYVWGETEEFAINAMEKGGIPVMVKDPAEMLGKIDALIVDHRHAKYHLEAAMPFIKERIPTFIDKPFCYRVEEGKKFLALARKLGTPVSSYSTSAHSGETLDIKSQVESLGKINHLVSFGPVDIKSVWGGVFFYGVHLVEPLMVIFGEEILKVRVSRNGNNATADLAFSDGMLATLIFLNMAYKFEMYAETKNGIVPLKARAEEPEPGKAYVDMVEMFRTGKEPRSHQSILKGIAVLEALEKSVESQQWIDVESIS
ncbi:MAG: Gfo/Idh/MocA family oxidoreductase [Cyclobacteriaceae bacterium]